MNRVSLVGTLTAEPELHDRPDQEPRCRLEISVGRRSRRGLAEPGIISVEVLTFGLEARDCADRLSLGDVVAVAGRLERDEWTGPPAEGLVVLIDQIDFLGSTRVTTPQPSAPDPRP